MFDMEMLKSTNLKGYRKAEKILERSYMFAEHIIDTHETIRQTAERFGCSKTLVHHDLSHRLPHYDLGLYQEVKQVLDENFAEKSFRGGEATRRKYAEQSI